MKEKLNIAIDGPASSGKSTIAKRIAEKLGEVYLDTGAMYRCVTLYALENGILPDDISALKNAFLNIEIRFETTDNGQIVLLNGEDVTEKIRSTSVTKKVSVYAAQQVVRTALVDMQQDIAKKTNGIVMDGRDIGTVVLPDAKVKIFLTATPNERAARRFRENQEKGRTTPSLQALTEEIKARDAYDMNREVSPLKKAKDAITIDSSGLTIEEVEAVILKHIKKITQISN